MRRNESKFGEIARLEIAAVLLACEQEESLSGDWYQLLSLEILPRDLKVIDEGLLSIISFNYDRSFERYFVNQFENLCGLTSLEAEGTLKKIRIEHVYGNLGKLSEIPNGDANQAASAANGIQTIRLIPDEAIRAKLREVLRSAVYVNFIGFGFDDDNLELLGAENFKGKRVYATTRGMSARTRNKIRQLLGVRFEQNEPVELSASQLFQTKDLFGPKRRPAPKVGPQRIRVRRGWMPRGWDIP